MKWLIELPSQVIRRRPGAVRAQPCDLESRKTNSGTKWMIDRNLLQGATSKIDFHPDIDLFASRLNEQFLHYVSFQPDPRAFAIDAFTLNLSHFQFYAFPPFSVISSLLQKIPEEYATRICILPDWPMPGTPKQCNCVSQQQ